MATDTKPEIKWDQKSLAALQPGPAVWTFADPTTPGLNLRVTPGGAKTYYYAYRLGGRGTTKKWLKVGGFRSITLDGARKAARAYRSDVDKGIDPGLALKAAASRGLTVAQLADRFIMDHLPKLKVKSQNDYKDSIRVHIKPGLGKIPVQDLTRDQVERWHAKGASAPIAMNRALAVLSSMLTRAEVWNLRKVQESGPNPCQHVDRFPEIPRSRDVEQWELVAVAAAMKALAETRSPSVMAAIAVIALCSGRVSEVISLRRDQGVHLAQGYSTIKDHKTSRKRGAKRLELPEAAVRILKDLPKEEGNPYYFPGRNKGTHITRHGIRAAWEAICAEAGVVDLHIHDFRSYAASQGLELGLPDTVVSEHLGHADTRTTRKHYSKVRKTAAADAAEKISAPIAKALGLVPAPPKRDVRKLLIRGFARVRKL